MDFRHVDGGSEPGISPLGIARGVEISGFAIELGTLRSASEGGVRKPLSSVVVFGRGIFDSIAPGALGFKFPRGRPSGLSKFGV